MIRDDAADRARAAFLECYDDVIPLPEGELEPGSYAALNMQMIGETWGGERLSMREKRMIVMSMLLAAGADPSLFLVHARCALKNGELSVEDIRSLINLGLFYCGVRSTSLPSQQFEAMVAGMD